MAVPAISHPVPIGAKVAAYVALMKPRIIELLLVTTVPTMVVAHQGVPSLWLIVATVLGGTLAAGGAHAVNMYVDRDIDAVMERTQGRPLVTGVVSPRSALVFAVTIEVIAFVLLWTLVNPLSAALALAACLFYVCVYTLWLKRSSTQNIVIGGAAGAVPVLIGWSAVTNTVSISAVVLFGVIFFWTPPHFWALALLMKDEYAKVGVPMLPVARGERETRRQILLYSVLLYAVTQLPFCAGGMGAFYLAASMTLGALFIAGAVVLYRRADRRSALRLYLYSLLYLALLFAAMVIDVRI